MIRIQKPPKKYTNSLEGEISKVSGSFILMPPSRREVIGRFASSGALFVSLSGR